MSHSDAIALLALLVSVFSLLVSGFTAYVDRPRLKVTATVIEASEWGPARIRVVLINKGRRPVIVTMYGGVGEAGKWSGYLFSEAKGGIRLAEHERHEFDWTRDDLRGFAPAGPDDMDDFEFRSLWVEDSLGQRHQVPGSDKLIDRVLYGAAARAS